MFGGSAPLKQPELDLGIKKLALIREFDYSKHVSGPVLCFLI